MNIFMNIFNDYFHKYIFNEYFHANHLEELFLKIKNII